mmetsp:Transcript_27053/g.63200  ORF Transcript_27053/g.63200 Transcript_27053/m.63200 type:complete len:92 (+) Transcript_27053:292-567(+)
MDMVHYLPSVCTTCPTVDPTVAAELHRPSPSDRVLSKARAYQVCVGCRAEVCVLRPRLPLVAPRTRRVACAVSRAPHSCARRSPERPLLPP